MQEKKGKLQKEDFFRLCHNSIETICNLRVGGWASQSNYKSLVAV